MELGRLKAEAERVAGTAPSGGVTLRDADAVVSTLRPRFRACYQVGLDSEPWMQGCVVIRTFIGPSGTVEKSEVFVREDLSDPVVACIDRVVRSAKFTAPGGRGSVLQIPVTFVNSGK